MIPIKPFIQRLLKKLDDALFYKIDEESTITTDGPDGYRYREGERELALFAEEEKKFNERFILIPSCSGSPRTRMRPYLTSIENE